MNAEEEIQMVSNEIEEHRKNLYLETDNSLRIYAVDELLKEYCHRASLYQHQGQLQEAIADYQKAINISKPYAKDEFIQDMVAECYVRSGFIKCQLKKFTGARDDFRYAFEIYSGADYIFSIIRDENPQDFNANLLDNLYGVSGLEIFPAVELIRIIQSNPKTVRELLPSYHIFREEPDRFAAILWLEMIVEYENRRHFVIIDPKGMVQDYSECLEKLKQYARFTAIGKHPLGLFGLGYYCSRSGDILMAILAFEALSRYFPEFSDSANSSILETMEQAPQAIRRYVEKREFRKAAVLAERAKDFLTAAKCYELLAIAVEKKEKNLEKSLGSDDIFSPDLKGNYDELFIGTSCIEPSVKAIIHFYQRAGECFEKAGSRQKTTLCWKNIKRLGGEPMRISNSHIFISYSWKDESIANQIAEGMKRAGIEYWLDKKDIHIGEPLLDRVRDGVTKESDYVLIVLSKDSVESEWCKLELRMAYAREMELKRIVVLPVRVGLVDMPAEVKIKKYFQLDPNDEGSFDALVQEIRLLLGKQTTKKLNRAKSPKTKIAQGGRSQPKIPRAAKQKSASKK